MQLLMLVLLVLNTILKELSYNRAGNWKLKLIMKLQHFIISVSKLLTQNFLECNDSRRVSVAHLQN